MSDTLLAALTSAAFAAIITSIIQAFVGRRKMTADTAKIIEDAAGAAVRRSEEEIKRVYERLGKAEKQISEMGESMSAMRKEMREKDRRVHDLEDQVEDLTDDLVAMVEYMQDMHDTLRSLDPHHRLLTFPPRIEASVKRYGKEKNLRRPRADPDKDSPPSSQQG